MTTANKDLPALPEPDSTACDYLRGIIKYHSATQVREILRAALARPEPASTPVAVESIVRALQQIEHSMMQARNPGNDRLREINLTLNIVQPLLASLQAAPQGQQGAASGACLTCNGAGVFGTPGVKCPFCAAKADPAQDAGVSLDEVHAFLFGSMPLDGVWFGNAHPNHPGKYWWREFLYRAISKTAPAQPAVDLVAAVEKLIKAKGRFHTEQNYVALVDAYDKYAAALARAQLEGKS